MFMSLRLYNTLTRSKIDFVPIDPAQVRLYACGPTVYDRAHIGNARPIIVFDMLFRVLIHHFGADRVRYVRNITDVDDKINARAAERGISIRDLTEGTAADFGRDTSELGTLPPTLEPRATDHIPEMQALIERLIARGHAYEAEGHVLFHVPSMPGYGGLSHRSLDEMEAGARVEVAPYKKDAMDFVLWKPSPGDLPGWDSPWGRGRPGWHIECSAMSWKHLGEVFDIHAGGIDLIFPHHENEIAQTCCAFGNPVMANVWMHNGFLQVEGEKMSKSLGNFVTIADVLKDWPGDVVRLAMLGTHYRQPINWTLKNLQEAEKALASWFDAAGQGAESRPAPAVMAALCDDLNTPQMITEIHQLRSQSARKALAGTLDFLGFRPKLFEHWREATAPEPSISIEEIEDLLEQRLSARGARDFAEADRIRNLLAERGIVVKDSPQGSTWEVAR
jgi:cysteinyl-tRNA synthetase